MTEVEIQSDKEAVRQEFTNRRLEATQLVRAAVEASPTLQAQLETAYAQFTEPAILPERFFEDIKRTLATASMTSRVHRLNEILPTVTRRQSDRLYRREIKTMNFGDKAIIYVTIEEDTVTFEHLQSRIKPGRVVLSPVCIYSFPFEVHNLFQGPRPPVPLRGIDIYGAYITCGISSHKGGTDTGRAYIGLETQRIWDDASSAWIQRFTQRITRSISYSWVNRPYRQRMPGSFESANR